MAYIKKIKGKYVIINGRTGKPSGTSHAKKKDAERCLKEVHRRVRKSGGTPQTRAVVAKKKRAKAAQERRRKAYWARVARNRRKKKKS